MAFESLLQFFEYEHLPPHLQEVSKPFHDLAHAMTGLQTEQSNYEQARWGLRRLLEAKDCFVRAAIHEAKYGQNNEDNNCS